MPVFLLCWADMDDAKAKQALQTLAMFDVTGLPVSESALKRWFHGDKELSGQEWRTVLDWHAKFSGLPSSRADETLALIRRQRFWLRLLCAWPGVRGLFLCNSVAFMNATEHSDTDLFIVCKPGQVWTTRFVLTALLKLAGKRPQAGKEAGTICLSFFIASDALSLSSIALPDDVYLSYWLATLIPVFDRDEIESRVLDVNRLLLPNTKIPHLRRVEEAEVDGFWLRCLRLLAWPSYAVVRLFGNPLKQWQNKRFPRAIVEAAKANDHRVVINDTMLKFHSTDRRLEYKQAFQKRYDILEKTWRGRTA